MHIHIENHFNCLTRRNSFALFFICYFFKVFPLFFSKFFGLRPGPNPISAPSYHTFPPPSRDGAPPSVTQQSLSILPARPPSCRYLKLQCVCVCVCRSRAKPCEILTSPPIVSCTVRRLLEPSAHVGAGQKFYKSLGFPAAPVVYLHPQCVWCL
jgi:hypothetical protein